MHAITPSTPVTALVTGANGYIAAHTIRTLLSRSPRWQVIGTVRSASKGTYLTEKLFKQEAEEGRLRVVIVEDIGLDGAFDEVFKSERIDVMFHMASPVTYQFEEIDGAYSISDNVWANGVVSKLCWAIDIIVPALKGTTSILASALKYGSVSVPVSSALPSFEKLTSHNTQIITQTHGSYRFNRDHNNAQRYPTRHIRRDMLERGVSKGGRGEREECRSEGGL